MGIRPPVGQNDDRAEALRKGYPLHPGLIETLMQKTSTLENFHRCGACCGCWPGPLPNSGGSSPVTPAIHLHHVDPGNERIRLEIATKLGPPGLHPGDPV
ncbi:MAG: hypothetical protein F4226_05580 [Synechococcus sp. SB0678_bin_12]|nr:hypothetical protein [Synechococcus sp. SB0678_bin_12]